MREYSFTTSATLRDAPDPGNGGFRVLLLPPTRRDGEAIGRLLRESQIACVVCESMESLCREVGRGAGAVLISEESLAADPQQFTQCISNQPVWSDLPAIVLSRSGSESPKLASLLSESANVAVLERPVRLSTFLSVVRSALRARGRQYQVREHLGALQAAEIQRSALLESERSARSEAERAGHVKDEFLATLSHEIRTPLSAILGWTHILSRDTAKQEDIAKGLAVIERNARAQSQIIADLLDMNRIVNGKVRLEVQQISVAQVVQAAVDTITPAADAKGVALQVKLDANAGRISGDPGRLQQVFWNILSNAVKFTPSGKTVKVHLERLNTHIEVDVIDSGEGISPEFLPHIFDRFRQADGSTTRRHGGLGLGLAIVKQLVELHGGSVRARSGGLGLGTAVTVVLPVTSTLSEKRPIERHKTGADRGSAPLQKFDDISGVKVLVVDDEPDSRDLVKRVLEGCHAQVTLASSAEQALQLLGEVLPDVLISDVGMPEEDGYSLMRRVRGRDAKQGGQVMAIAFTAYARAEDRINALRAGFQYHLAKPVEVAELIALVAHARAKAR